MFPVSDDGISVILVIGRSVPEICAMLVLSPVKRSKVEVIFRDWRFECFGGAAML